MRRTADSIEESKSLKTESTERKKYMPRPQSLANLKPYPKGVSGNPGGRPKYDVSAELARAVIEQYKEEAYAGLAVALCKGNAYVFKELAERGYGKLKEVKEVTHVYQEIKDGDLQQRIDSILADLGIAAQIDASGRTEGIKAGAGKTNGHAKDTPVLS